MSATSSDSLGFVAGIKTAIQGSHDAIEQTPFALAIMKAGLSRDDYAFYLRQMLAIHELLDRYLAQAPLRDWVPTTAKRTPAILADLDALDVAWQSLPVLDETRQILEAMQAAFESAPLSLLGYVYILEGSRMGSRVLAKPLREGLQLGDAGLRYHLDDFAEQPKILREFKARLDEHLQDSDLRLAIATAAGEFMDALLTLYRVLPVAGFSEKTALPSASAFRTPSLQKCPYSHAAH